MTLNPSSSSLTIFPRSYANVPDAERKAFLSSQVEKALTLHLVSDVAGTQLHITDKAIITIRGPAPPPSLILEIPQPNLVRTLTLTGTLTP